ncbi:MAG: hypothetical protein IE931_04510 [Sphingobacteriales bacterium]|nr:hypothetical protein [Sphingobacteriales bacterium]
MEDSNIFKIHLKLLKHGWMDFKLSLDNENINYIPNTYCLPLHSLIEGALFSLKNRNIVGEEFEFSHDAEQDGECFWDIKIVENQKLKLLVRLNPDLQLTEEITELGLKWAFKYYWKEIKFLKEDTLIAIEINCVAFSKEIFRSISQLANKISQDQYKKKAHTDFPSLTFNDLEKELIRLN